MRNLLPALAAGVLLGDLLTSRIPIVGIAIAYIIGDIGWVALREVFPKEEHEGVA